MTNIVISGEITNELLTKIQQVVAGEQVEMHVAHTTEEKNELFRTNYESAATAHIEKEIAQVVENFIATYAVEFKKNNCPIPRYFTVSTGQEYNDEDYDLCLSSVNFYDKEKDYISVDFDVECGNYEEPFSYVMKTEIEESGKFDISDIEQFIDGKYLEINL